MAWWRSFGLLAARPPFASLVGVRLSVEAVMLGLPSGAVISESLQPWLLKRRCGVPFETAVVAGVGRKFFVVVSHGLVLSLATILTWPLLARVSRGMIGRAGLPWLLLGVSAFMIATFGVGLALSGRARLAQRTRALLNRVGGRWLGDWLERHSPRFQRADEHLVAFFERERGALVLPMLLYATGWIVRGAETYLFLRLLGADVPFSTALVVETAIIVVRSVAVPVPAGLGVQDVGYVLCLRALGVPDATTVGTAFVLLEAGQGSLLDPLRRRPPGHRKAGRRITRPPDRLETGTFPTPQCSGALNPPNHAPCAEKGYLMGGVAMSSSPSAIDRACFRAWCATYPPKGGAEALATVSERLGGFDVSVTAVGWALEGRGLPTRACREATLEAARARADALAAELLGRQVFARWHETATDAL